MAFRTDLPRNRFLARDVQLLEACFGPQYVHWDRLGRWVQLDRLPISSCRFQLSLAATYVVVMVPSDYGERAGIGAGLEEFYVHRNLRIRRPGRGWQGIPHTFDQIDRRGGQAVSLRHRYACVHISWHPDRDTILTSIKLLRMMLADPWAFERIGK